MHVHRARLERLEAASGRPLAVVSVTVSHDGFPGTVPLEPTQLIMCVIWAATGGEKKKGGGKMATRRKGIMHVISMFAFTQCKFSLVTGVLAKYLDVVHAVGGPLACSLCVSTS